MMYLTTPDLIRSHHNIQRKIPYHINLTKKAYAVLGFLYVDGKFVVQEKTLSEFKAVYF